MIDVETKVAYFETCVHLIEVLYVDANTDTALRQRAKEEAERMLDLLAKEIQPERSASSTSLNIGLTNHTGTTKVYPSTLT